MGVRVEVGGIGKGRAGSPKVRSAGLV